ncbi:unnamed protein product [Amoebophrya sp. A25]|nr:unnamed protein product [Amoebophrya sp. A25]|eukprot:GSA25T00008075001.1
MADANPALAITKLWRIRKTTSEMLEDRGYMVSLDFKNETRAQFEEAYTKAQQEGMGRERFVILCCHKNDPEQKILVYFPDENKKVGVKPIRVLAEKMHDNKIDHAILVVRQSLTPFAKSAIGETLSKMRIEVFHENELVVNITKHDLVPTHQPLTDAEKKYLLQRYQLKPSQLPRIQMNDPIARYFGLQREAVVKVIRPSETAGRYVTYRLVV